MAYDNAWDEDIPAGTEAISLGDNRIRALKKDVRQRLAEEHTDITGTSGTAALRHNAGRCAVAYYGTTAEIAALSSPPQYSLAYDTTLGAWKYYTGSAWTTTFYDGSVSYPWIVDVDVFADPHSNTNWSTITAATSCIHGGYLLSSGAQNDQITWDVILAAGTWTIWVLSGTHQNGGIITVYLDDESQGTIDEYWNGVEEVNNVESTFTSISISATGKKTLKLKMATKNASSSSYYGKIQHVRFLRTA